MKKLLFTTIAIGMMFYAGNVLAASFTFDFTLGSPNSSMTGVVFTSNEDPTFTLTATGQNFGGKTSTLSYGTGSGLNLYTDDTANEIDAIDGLWTERVLFEFSDDVTISSINFAAAYNDNGFAFWTETPWYDREWDHVDIPSDTTYDFTEDFTSSVFAIGAIEGADSFKLQSITVEYSLDPTTGLVPEPTTMLLFGVGIAGLAGFSRKKKK